MLKRFSLGAYTRILTGSMLRLLLQALYLASLVNALPLADYGVFASTLALSLILSGGGTFGFAAPLFRAATTRRRVLGHYVSALIAYVAVECGAVLLIGSLIYGLGFKVYLGYGSFLAILISESLFWRIVDVLFSVNMGLGRYSRAAMPGIVGSAGRLAAVGLFIATGRGSLAHWSLFYLAGNALATALAVALFAPRVRLRWHGGILRRRAREAVSFWAINTLQTFQIEADKLIVLGLAGEHQAGIYALSMRLIELMLLPIKSFFPPYVQSLLRSRDRFANWRKSLAVEGSLSVSALALFLAAAAVLTLFPRLAGDNVAQAADWFKHLPLVPVSRAMLDYHREVMFAAERLTTYAFVAAGLAAMRLGTVAGVLLLTASIDALLLPLNVVALLLYATSASVVWGLVIRPPALTRRGVPSASQDYG